MLIAGGSANWSRRTNLYNDSESTKPKWTAYLIVRTPNIGIKIYRTAVIPIITETGTFDPLKPENTFWSSFWLFRNLHIYIYISSKRDADPSKYTESSITWRGALWSPISAFRKGGITPIINPTIYESKAVRGVNPRIASILKHKGACLVYTLSDILTWPRNRRGKKSGLKLHAAC